MHHTGINYLAIFGRGTEKDVARHVVSSKYNVRSALTLADIEDVGTLTAVRRMRLTAIISLATFTFPSHCDLMVVVAIRSVSLFLFHLEIDSQG